MVFYELLWSIQVRALESLGSSQLVSTRTDNLDNFFPQDIPPYISKFSEILNTYTEIQKFIVSIENLRKNNTSLPYISAFIEGINIIDKEFMQTLCEIEKIIFEDGDFSPVSIFILIEPVAESLSSILDGIKDIKRKQISGCLIIDLCLKNVMSGLPNVKKTYEKLTKYCLRPFFKHTKAWIVYSHLRDPDSEYFIDKSLNAESATVLNIKDKKNYEKYSIDTSRLPQFLSYSVASKILYIGQTMLFCKKDRPKINSISTDNLLKEYGLDEKTLISKIEEIEKNQKFSTYSFEIAITEIWSCVDKFARKLADEVGGLKNQLIKMKDIYLLGRGELFQEFLIRANDLLTKEKPSNAVFRSLKIQFKNSFYYVYRTDSSELLDSINIKMTLKRKPSSKMLDILLFDMNMQWPLDSLFTPLIIENFNKVFKFLLKLKRSQIDISEVWAITNSRQEIKIDSESLIFRNNLLSLVGNLQNYCFSIIASEINQLMIVINNTDTYYAIQLELAKFQENLLQQLFLFDMMEEASTKNETDNSTHSSMTNLSGYKYNNYVYKFFEVLMKISHKYSRIVKESEYKKNLSVIKGLKTQLETSINALMTLVNGVDINYNNSYLRNLMLSLDFNSYFCH